MVEPLISISKTRTTTINFKKSFSRGLRGLLTVCSDGGKVIKAKMKIAHKHKQEAIEVAIETTDDISSNGKTYRLHFTCRLDADTVAIGEIRSLLPLSFSLPDTVVHRRRPHAAILPLLCDAVARRLPPPPSTICTVGPVLKLPPSEPIAAISATILFQVTYKIIWHLRLEMTT